MIEVFYLFASFVISSGKGINNTTVKQNNKREKIFYYL